MSDQHKKDGYMSQQPLDGVAEAAKESPHMVARINALAVKIVFPFMAQQDIRFYLCGINIRPLDEGVMALATDGHRYIVVRDPQGFTEKEIIVSVMKDAMKHATAKNTFDVMSNGAVVIHDAVAQAQFIQPGNALVEGDFPRIENVASTIGYKEGISGTVNPAYIADALEIADQFGSIRFFTKDADSPLCFVFGGIGELECFGGIMKMRDSFNDLPAWFPKRSEPTTLAQM